MNSPPKKVLLVTYYFPPSGGAAVQRIMRMIKYLPQFGWQPVVLTIRNGDYPTTDFSLLENVPQNTKVYRTYIPEPYRLYRKLTNRGSEEALDLSTLAVSVGGKVNFRERFASFIRSWFFIPDARIGWLPFALLKGQRIIEKEKIDLIFSSAPPNTVHLVAYGLKKLTGRKWVADFRDPWFKFLVPERNFYLPRKIDLTMCQAVVRTSDHLIWVCDGVRKEIEAVCANHFSDKATILTNAYDEEDFRNLSFEPDNRFSICYVGSLFITYDLTSFITAIENICRDDSEFKNNLHLVFCGRVDAAVEKKLRQAAFYDCVEFLGYQNHRKSIEIMISSTILLLYVIDAERGKNIPTSKLYEYIGAKRPILALAPEDSEAAKIIIRTKSGVAVHPNNPESIEMTIIDLYEKWKSGLLDKSNLDENEIGKYESKNVMKRLVQILDKMVMSPKAKTYRRAKSITTLNPADE